MLRTLCGSLIAGVPMFENTTVLEAGKLNLRCPTRLNERGVSYPWNYNLRRLRRSAGPTNREFVEEGRRGGAKGVCMGKYRRGEASRSQGVS